MELKARQFRRILLVKPSSLGDIIHALPVLHGLRVRYPSAHISWLVAKDFRSLIDGHPDLDEVIEFDRRRFAKFGRSWAATRDFRGFLGDLARRRFDLAIDLQGLFRSGFLTWASRAPVRLGFAAAREMAPVFYTHRLPRHPPDTHAAVVNYRVAEVLGFADVPMQFDLALTQNEHQRAQRTLADELGDSDRPFVAILPGARWDTKRWSPDRFAVLAGRIDRDLHHRVVLLGGPSESALCATVAAGSGSSVVNLAGKTDLRLLAAILNRAACVVCHDSAPMHMAAALRRPLVCILGPTNPKRTGPHGTTATILQADLPCVPCYLRNLSDCPYDHQCMREIVAHQVFFALQSALSESSAAVPST